MLMEKSIPQTALVPDSDYIIFGGTGDLALRKIFPALFWRFCDGQLTDKVRLIAVARNSLPLDTFLDKLRPFCEDAFSTYDMDESLWADFARLITIMPIDIMSGKGGTELAAFIAEKKDDTRPAIYYLAVAPALFGSACQLLSELDLVWPQSRLVVEKP
ncbi:MAG: glucose-6-phosphate dehydrogenase, partial [Candidatus Puniceispirillaceae bacterium]